MKMKSLYTKEEVAALETNDEDEDEYKRLINNSSRSSSMSNGDERLLQAGRCSSIMMLMLPITTISVSQRLKKLRDGYVDAMLSFSQHAVHNAHLYYFFNTTTTHHHHLPSLPY